MPGKVPRFRRAPGEPAALPFLDGVPPVQPANRRCRVGKARTGNSAVTDRRRLLVEDPRDRLAGLVHISTSFGAEALEVRRAGETCFTNGNAGAQRGASSPLPWRFPSPRNSEVAGTIWRPPFGLWPWARRLSGGAGPGRQNRGDCPPRPDGGLACGDLSGCAFGSPLKAPAVISLSGAVNPPYPATEALDCALLGRAGFPTGTLPSA